MIIEGILVLALNFGGNNLLTNPFIAEYWQNLQNNIIKNSQQKVLVSPTPRPTTKPTSKPTVKSSTTTFSAQQILTALNNYRSSKGIGKLQFDQKLQDYAQSRSNYLKQRGSLDNHAEFNNFIQNQDGFSKLGFNALAENQSWNYKGTADGLISDFYAKSPGHNTNQLSGEYTHVGIGVTGEYTNLVFGGRKR